MKIVSLAFLFLIACQFCFGQNRHQVDSLKHLLLTAKEDTNKVRLLLSLSQKYIWTTVEDTTLFYAQQSLKLAEKLNDARGIAQVQRTMSIALINIGNYPLALEYGLKARSGFEKLKDTLSMVPSSLVYCFKEQGDFDNAMKYHVSDMNLLALYYSNKNRMNTPEAKQIIIDNWAVLGHLYAIKNQLDSSIKYAEKALDIRKGYSGLIHTLGNDYLKKGQYDKAMYYFKLGLNMMIKQHFPKDMIEINTGIARVFLKKNNLDSAVFYCEKVVDAKYGKFFPRELLSASTMLASIYEAQHKPDSAYKYFKQTIALKETLSNKGKIIAIQNLLFKEDQKEKELEAAELTYQNRLKMYGLLGGLVGLLLVAFFLWRNNRHKQQAYNILENQKKETDFQKEKVEHTLSQLKATQNQLIQKEKLASLGELTAGIAHEIQNPLNFVNNFSEVSGELVDEMNEEIDKGNYEEAKEISSDLKQNLQKINHHGKRASNIVKGMLEHSRSSTGERVLTDINALADEYLRLSFHGMKAKNKDFTADFKTDFDPNVPKVEVIPQEIGRVILNLLNNAFYSVGQPGRLSPKVIIATKTLESAIEIRVKDNGSGISKANLAKIFQPFFTTKPTGEGTGLGLSLSYDIVTKGHGGTLEVISVEGEGAEFIIRLPI